LGVEGPIQERDSGEDEADYWCGICEPGQAFTNKYELHEHMKLGNHNVTPVPPVSQGGSKGGESTTFNLDGEAWIGELAVSPPRIIEGRQVRAFYVEDLIQYFAEATSAARLEELEGVAYMVEHNRPKLEVVDPTKPSGKTLLADYLEHRRAALTDNPKQRRRRRQMAPSDGDGF
jgi:hypothetical protein